VGDYARFGEADLIIEAATEREDIKAQHLRGSGQVSGRKARFMASNTSSIPITRMAAWRRPIRSRFIGVHFFNPVPLMKLVEVIPGASLFGGYDCAPCARLRARCRQGRGALAG